MTKTLLLLGGSRQQVIAIETAKQLGYRTVLCDYLPNNPGQYTADAFYQTSTTDCDAVLKVAKKEKVDGVLAYASDPAAPTAAYVAEKLGLPGNPLKAVKTLSEKHLFRRHLLETGLPCPKVVDFAADTPTHEVEQMASRLRWPIVVKPTDSSGSKGVSVVSDLACLGHALEAARGRSRNGVLIAEEYINFAHPYVIGGDVFVLDGEVRFWGLMDCLRDKSLGGLVPSGEALPSGVGKAQREKIKTVVQRLVSSLGISFGELNVEVVLADGDTPYVLELGARAGGNMIPVQLSDASGINLVEANVRCAMGDDPGDICYEGEQEFYAHVVLHAEHDGVFSAVDYGALAPYVYREVLYHNVGERVRCFRDASDAVGITFLKFPDEQVMRSLLFSSASSAARAIVQ